MKAGLFISASLKFSANWLYLTVMALTYVGEMNFDPDLH
jgi:hypothetical protein